MSKFIYSLKQACKQVKRNKGMAFTSTFAITAMLIILGMFFMVIININTAAEMIKSDYNNIELFLKDKVSEKHIEELREDISQWDEVNTADIRTKEEAMEILKLRWGDNGYLLEGLDDNPLPNSIVITVDDLEQADSVVAKAGKLDEVEDVSYYKDTVDKLMSATRGFQIAAVVVMVFLIIVSTVVVSNTVKLTVFNRADEIVIMKYVGATNWFIRAPFLLEGILIGLVSALLAVGIISLIYKSVVEVIGNQITLMLSTPLVPLSFISFNLVWIFIALGVSIGAWGSMISMRRFLDTK